MNYNFYKTKLSLLITLIAAFQVGAIDRVLATENLPEIATQQGCRDALNLNRYKEKNFKQTIGKIIRTHRYDSRKLPENLPEKSLFNYAVIGNFENLLSFIRNNCEFNNTNDIKDGAACYYKCPNNIGLYYNGVKHIPTQNIHLNYMKHKFSPNNYYLLSIYPAHPISD
ncbi:MAG: hypothetical protein ABFQ95_07535 [Pseudomonadota bacterium]